MSERRAAALILAAAIICVALVLLARGAGGVRGALGVTPDYVRAFNEDLSVHDPVPCPSPGETLFLASGGQSNAANSLGGYHPEDHARETLRYEPVDSPLAIMFWNGACYALRSPMLGPTDHADSIWPRLAASLGERREGPVMMVGAAVGGSRIDHWLDPRSGYLERLADQVRQAAAMGYRLDGVLWIQGETDASAMREPQRYGRAQERLVEAFASAIDRAGDPPDWLVFPSTKCGTRANRGAELEAGLLDYVSRPGDAVHRGPSLTSYPDALRRDGCHLNWRGRDRLVEDTLRRIEELGLWQGQGSG